MLFNPIKTTINLILTSIFIIGLATLIGYHVLYPDRPLPLTDKLNTIISSVSMKSSSLPNINGDFKGDNIRLGEVKGNVEGNHLRINNITGNILNGEDIIVDELYGDIENGTNIKVDVMKGDIEGGKGIKVHVLSGDVHGGEDVDIDILIGEDYTNHAHVKRKISREVVCD